MKESTPVVLTIKSDSLQEKISVLNENDFLWKDIAVITGLPKELIEEVAQNKCVLTEEQCNMVGEELDKAIEKYVVPAFSS